jgi:hypothetical protein
LKNHPIRCGLLKYELQLQLHHKGRTVEHLTGDVLSMGWLYVIGSRIIHPEARRWLDMELLLYKQEDRLFHGKFTATLGEVSMRPDLARGADHGIRTLRRFEDLIVLGTLFMHRVADAPETTEDADKWAFSLVNMMCKPETQ